MLENRKALPLIKITKDFETQSECDLKKSGAFEYSMHPTTRVLCMAFKFPHYKNALLFKFEQMQKPYKSFSPEFRIIWERAIKEPQFIFSAHNSFFETCIYNNVLVRRLGWPTIPIEKRRCTAAKAAAMAIPRNLADAGAVMKLKVQKDYEGHRVMLKLCKPTSAWKQWNDVQNELKAGRRLGFKKQKIAEKEEPLKFWTPETAPHDFSVLYKYCMIDVESEEQLDNALPDLNPFEQKLWFIDQKINLRGIKVDMDVVNKISGIMEAENRTMNNELDILTMGLVSSGNARNAILDFLTVEGLEMPDLRAKTVDDFLANGKATGDAKKILEIRRALSKSSTAKYHTFQRRAKTDGRVRDLLLYHGASTGRWGGVGIQPQNFPRGIIKNIFEAIDRIKTCTVDELKLLYGENLMPLFSSVLRGMFVSTPGMEMHVQDWNAIECRITFWLAGHEEGLQMFRDGRDPYKEMAVDIYTKGLLDINDDERQVGKAAVLGCGFQMGEKKFITSAWDVYRARVTKEVSRIAVKAYRKKHYPVTEMWANYNDAAIQAVENPSKKYRVGKVKFYMEGNFLKIELPSTRKLAYAYPKIEMGTVVKMKEKDGEINYVSNVSDFKAALSRGAKKVDSFKSKRLTYMAVNHKAKKIDCEIPKWTREKTYGGKLTENIVQAVARDLLAAAIVRADKYRYDVLMHSHDEMVSEKAPNPMNEKGYKRIMEMLPAWAEGLPLKASGWMGDRYKKG